MADSNRRESLGQMNDNTWREFMALLRSEPFKPIIPSPDCFHLTPSPPPKELLITTDEYGTTQRAIVEQLCHDGCTYIVHWPGHRTSFEVPLQDITNGKVKVVR